MYPSFKYLILFLFLSFLCPIRAQKGDYFFKNYLPKDYSSGANNFGITQDNNGIIYVANDNGILIFDGINWQLCRSPNEVTVNSINKNAKGTIFFGTIDGDFGIVEKNKKGKYKYTSLRQNLPDGDKPTDAIKQITVLNDIVYFLSSDKLVELKNSSLKVYKPINTFHVRALPIGKHLFLIDLDNSILVLENGVLNPVKKTEELASIKPWFCYKLSTNEYALGIRNEGIYKLLYDSINPKNSTFELIDAPCNESIKDVEINNGTALKNGNFIITSNKKGAFEINKNLQIVKRYNTKTNLNDDNVKAVFEDENSNLWFSLYYGISYIETNAQLFKYSRSNGIAGLVQSATYFENKLYIATDKGVQYFDEAEQQFLFLQEFNKQSWFLLNFSNKLFICTQKGLFIYNGKTIKQINDRNVSFLLNDPYQINVLYAATDDGVDVYNLSGEELTFIKSYSLNNKVKSLASDSYKNIYFATENNGIYFLNYSNSYLLDSIQELNGLPNKDFENYVFTYRSKLLIGTDSGLYRIKPSINKKFICVKDPVFWALTKNSEIFRATELEGDIVCQRSYDNKGLDKIEKKIIYISKTKNSFKINNKGIGHLKDVKPNLITFDSLNKVVFISCDEGLFILNNQKIKDLKYNLLLKSLSAKKDTLLQNCPSNFDFANEKIEIKYINNDISFAIGYNCFENISNVEFEYYLEGKEKTYNKRDKKSELNYNNLSEGDYIFHLKAYNELSDTILEMHIPFTILPPWYRSIWAYIVYTIFFILFLLLVIKLNSKRLVAQNKKLEATITERTSTIENQKQELEHKQKEIIDSINYAQRIQRALLASKLLLDENLKNTSQSRDYFIYFQPKDIVSGDFYWASKLTNSNFTIAIADSTGHGVPGAIMSMLNISCLKEAVIAQKLINPNEILNYTRTKIIETLANDGSAEGGKDGMDCSLLSFNLTANTLTYSSANNPIWIIKNNSELIELKADKMPVGKHDRDSVSFTQETIQLQKGDLVYASTDGLPDQFGGPKGKKFMYKQLKELLIQISSKPLNEQASIIKEQFNNWKQDLEQVDDVLVFGFRV